MTLLEVSFSGAVFIIAVVLIRAIAINSLPKKTFLVLWEMVLLRLVIPFTIPSAFSIYTLINNTISTPTFFEAETNNVASAVSREYFVVIQGIEQPVTNIPFVSVRFIVWCIGMILFAGFFIVSYLRCRIEFRTALPVNNAYVEQWIKERPLKRRISIKQSDRISTPLTYGVLHPVILMPKQTDWKNINQLRYIFSHEYVHIYRFDTITKLIATYALCIHWFNPLVWVMYILFNRDIELACDESVIRQFGDKSKSAYSLMLISMEAKKSGLSPLCNNFSKNAIEERITAIMNTKRTTIITLLSACLIVLVTVSLFATSAIASTDSKTSDTLTINDPKTNTSDIIADVKGSTMIIHESADILHYEDGAPYIHDILTNNTDKGALVAFAGMDAPPFQSGTFDSKSRRISKRGSPHLRKTLFMVASTILQHSDPANPIFQFMDKKRAEGKHFYVYTVAGAAKFLRIYYARVKTHLAMLDSGANSAA